MLPPINENRATNRTGHTRRRRSQSSSSDGVEETGFSELLAQSIEPSVTATPAAAKARYKDINEMLEELHEYEQNLLQYPNETNYDAYKKKVKQIAAVLLKDAYELKVVRDRSRREFEIIKTIDMNLHEIFQKLVTHNPDLGAVLRHMGNIQGILLDLKV